MQNDGRRSGKGNASLQLEADALSEVQAGQPRVLDESTRKSLASGEAEFYVLNLGCAGESLVMNCWNWMQLEHITLTGLPEIASCQRSSKEVRKEER